MFLEHRDDKNLPLIFEFPFDLRLKNDSTCWPSGLDHTDDPPFAVILRGGSSGGGIAGAPWLLCVACCWWLCCVADAECC